MEYIVIDKSKLTAHQVTSIMTILDKQNAEVSGIIKKLEDEKAYLQEAIINSFPDINLVKDLIEDKCAELLVENRDLKKELLNVYSQNGNKTFLGKYSDYWINTEGKLNIIESICSIETTSFSSMQDQLRDIRHIIKDKITE